MCPMFSQGWKGPRSSGGSPHRPRAIFMTSSNYTLSARHCDTILDHQVDVYSPGFSLCRTSLSTSTLSLGRKQPCPTMPMVKSPAPVFLSPSGHSHSRLQIPLARELCHIVYLPTSDLCACRRTDTDGIL